MKNFISSVFLSAVAASSLLAAGTPVSASATTHTTEEAVDLVSAQVKPPKIKQMRYTCHSEGAIISLKLRNPNRTELSWHVQLFNDDMQEAQAVTLAGKTAEQIEFHGISNGESSIQVLDDLGETVTTAQVIVECPPAIGRMR